MNVEFQSMNNFVELFNGTYFFMFKESFMHFLSMVLSFYAIDLKRILFFFFFFFNQDGFGPSALIPHEPGTSLRLYPPGGLSHSVAGSRTRDGGHLSGGSYTTRPRGPVRNYFANRLNLDSNETKEGIKVLGLSIVRLRPLDINQFVAQK